MAGFEAQGQEIGAGISVIAVDSQPGDGPARRRHEYTEVAPAGVPHRFVNSGPGRLVQVDIHENDHFVTEWL
jgi:hypothetical protein